VPAAIALADGVFFKRPRNSAWQNQRNNFAVSPIDTVTFVSGAFLKALV
jgi:hypothetical protein